MEKQTTHDSEYMQAIFSAMLRVIEEPATVASNTSRLRLIQHLCYIGHEGKMEGRGPEDFNYSVICDWLESIERGRFNNANEPEMACGQPNKER